MFMLRATVIALGLCGSTAFAELKSVPFVDLNQYAGRWYQISANPMPYDTGCTCSQQTLGANQDGTLSVYNSCNRGDVNGPLTEIRGTATSEDKVSNARYSVDFGMPQKGAYWLVGIAPDYSWAIVSEPSMKALYVLSKTPTLSDDAYQTAVDTAATQIDTGALKMTEQQGCSYPTLAP